MVGIYLCCCITVLFSLGARFSVVLVIKMQQHVDVFVQYLCTDQLSLDCSGDSYIFGSARFLMFCYLSIFGPHFVDPTSC